MHTNSQWTKKIAMHFRQPQTMLCRSTTEFCDSPTDLAKSIHTNCTPQRFAELNLLLSCMNVHCSYTLRLVVAHVILPHRMGYCQHENFSIYLLTLRRHQQAIRSEFQIHKSKTASSINSSNTNSHISVMIPSVFDLMFIHI